MTHQAPRANTARNTPTKHAQSAEAACKALYCLTDAMCSLEHGAEALENLMHLLRIGQTMDADDKAAAALLTVATHYV